jgi:predicted RNA-binding protein associated with RNAse of E/G family
VDVIIYPDGFVKVVDLDELAAALEERLIDEEALKKCLRIVDKLLRYIYSGAFEKMKKQFDDVS